MFARFKNGCPKIVLIGLAAFFLLTGCTETLYSNLSENEINEMMALLIRNDIKCQKLPGEEGAWNLSITDGKFAQAVSVLKDNGYPKEAHQSIGDVFKKSGLVSSPSEERIRFIYALSEEVSNTISKIDGIIDARVHIVLPENNPFADNVLPSSASVFIRHKPNYPIDSQTLRIKEMVATSIEGLAFDKITVALFPAEMKGEDRCKIAIVRVMGMLVAQESVKSIRYLITAVIAMGLSYLLAGGWFAYKKLNLDIARLGRLGFMKMPMELLAKRKGVKK